MIHKKKKGYISVEYIIVAGLILASVAIIFVAQFPGYVSDINTKAEGILSILSSDEQ